MNASDLIRRLHQHRMWVNHRLLEAVRPLANEQLRQPFPIGQGSVWKTLTHLVAAEHVWLEALVGNESPVMPGTRRTSCREIRKAKAPSSYLTNWQRSGRRSTGDGRRI